MKIAVFGDSYAADCDWNFTRYPGWVERLRRLEPTWIIDNHARHGSSFWYSWSQFGQRSSQYDHIIVFVTHWDRHTFYTNSGPDPWCHMPGIRNVQSAIDTFPQHIRPSVRALEQYWLLVDQEQQRQEQHDLMLANIQQLAPGALIVPCFNWEGSRLASPSQTTIQDISDMDIPLELRQDFYQKYNCERTNHMNELNLDLMALTMKTWVLTGQLDWDSQPWGADTQRPLDYYFKRI